jgi:hypothetical protein
VEAKGLLLLNYMNDDDESINLVRLYSDLKGKQPSLTLSLLLAEVLEIPNKNLLVDIISSKATSFNILNVLLEFGID